MWVGGRIKLVSLDPERHLDNAVRWLNDPEVTRWLLIGDFPITRLAEERWFQRMAESQTDVVFAIETLEGVHIGFSGLHQINFRNGHAITATMIGEREYWGRGLGKESARLRTRYAFWVLNLRLLEARVFPENQASIRMLRAVGYREVGRIPKKNWKRGAWRDTVIMVLLREWWEETQ